MATKQMKVVKGEKGYVPVYSNSHGGLVLGHVDNEKYVYWITTIPMEEGYVQLDKRVLQDAAPDMKESETGEYWMEKSHLEEVTVVPPVTDGEKYQLLGVDYSVVPPVVTMKKL